MHRTARLRSFIQRRSFSPPGLYCLQHPPKYRPQHILAGTINGDFKNCSHRQFGWTTSWSTVRLFSSAIDGRLSSDDLNKVFLEFCVHISCYRKSRCSRCILQSSTENSKLYIYPIRERSPKSNSYCTNRKKMHLLMMIKVYCQI